MSALCCLVFSRRCSRTCESGASSIREAQACLLLSLTFLFLLHRVAVAESYIELDRGASFLNWKILNIGSTIALEAQRCNQYL